jgi:hypothetical protein
MTGRQSQSLADSAGDDISYSNSRSIDSSTNDQDDQARRMVEVFPKIA